VKGIPDRALGTGIRGASSGIKEFQAADRGGFASLIVVGTQKTGRVNAKACFISLKNKKKKERGKERGKKTRGGRYDGQGAAQINRHQRKERTSRHRSFLWEKKADAGRNILHGGGDPLRIWVKTSKIRKGKGAAPRQPGNHVTSAGRR